jgi:hypothetical protein
VNRATVAVLFSGQKRHGDTFAQEKRMAAGVFACQGVNQYPSRILLNV